MKSCLWLNLASAALVITAGSSALFAQDFSESAYKETSGKMASHPPQKAHKVCTDEDMSSVKTTADRYQDQKQASSRQQCRMGSAKPDTPRKFESAPVDPTDQQSAVAAKGASRRRYAVRMAASLSISRDFYFFG